MKKRIVLLGLALLAVAAVVFFVDSGYVVPQLQMTAMTVNVSSNGYGYATLNFSPPASFIYIVKASLPINLYLMNASGFSAWKLQPRSANQTGLADANSLFGNGVFQIYQNVTLISVPQVGNITTAPIENSSGIYPPGRYYIVEDNTYGSPSQAKPIATQVLFPTYLINGTSSSVVASQFTKEIVTGSEIAIVALVMGAASLLVLVYGIISKPKEVVVPGPSGKPAPKNPKEIQEDKEIDELYKKAKVASKRRKSHNKDDE